MSVFRCWAGRIRPHLIWIDALCLLGGYFNAGAILLHRQPASHHTGNLSHLALSLSGALEGSLFELLGVLLAFLAGATCAGFLFHDRSFRPSRRYGLTLICMGLGLLVGIQIGRGLLFLGAACMGLQNGLFIYDRDILVRSTHMSGTLTDFAFALGSFLRGQSSELRRIRYHGFAILSFFLGALAAPGVLRLGARAFWLTLAGAYLVMGAFYFWLRSGNHFHWKEEA